GAGVADRGVGAHGLQPVPGVHALSVAPGATGFEEYTADRNLVAARLCAVLAAVLMPAGFTLDWITQPERLTDFLVLRLVASALATGLLALTYLPGARRFVYPLGIGPVMVCAGAIELMIVELGAHSSAYYAGLNLCILGVGVIFTWRLGEAILACLLV